MKGLPGRQAGIESNAPAGSAEAKPGPALARFAARFLAMVGACAWIGGFMFYGGAVVPILEDVLGSLDAGMITRRVTDVLNGVGVVTLAVFAVLVALEWREGRRWVARSRLALLILSAGALVALMVLHGVMDAHLDERGTRGFRPLHRLYLMISTGQWLANLGLLALTVRLWTTLGRASPRG